MLQKISPNEQGLALLGGLKIALISAMLLLYAVSF